MKLTCLLSNSSLESRRRIELARCEDNRADDADFRSRVGTHDFNRLRDQLWEFKKRCEQSDRSYEPLQIDKFEEGGEEGRIAFENVILKKFPHTYNINRNKGLTLSTIPQLPDLAICDLFVLITDSSPYGTLHIFGATPKTTETFQVERDIQSKPNSLHAAKWPEDTLARSPVENTINSAILPPSSLREQNGKNNTGGQTGDVMNNEIQNQTSDEPIKEEVDIDPKMRDHAAAIIAALKSYGFNFISPERLAKEFDVPSKTMREFLDARPDVVRRADVRDQRGNGLYALATRPIAMIERWGRLYSYINKEPLPSYKFQK